MLLAVYWAHFAASVEEEEEKATSSPPAPASLQPACPPEAGRLAEHSYSIPGCLTPPDDSPPISTPGQVTPYVSPPSSPPTLTPQRPLSPPTPELLLTSSSSSSCPDTTPKYKTNMLYRYLQDAAEAHETFAEDCR